MEPLLDQPLPMDLANISASSATMSTLLTTIARNRTCLENIMPENFDLNRFYFISCYVLMLSIGAIENISALCALIKHRYRNRGAKLLLINLTVANLIIALIVIPIEIVWRITYVWPTGQMGCKILQFVRALGHYSTSMMLVVISLDRFLVLTKPFTRQSTKNVVIMIILAWMAALLLSIPQSIVFSLQKHPNCPQFIQCVPFNYFTKPWGLKFYNIFCLTAVYFIPLTIISSCYGVILRNVWKERRELHNLGMGGQQPPPGTPSQSASTPQATTAVASLAVANGSANEQHIVTWLNGRRQNAYMKTIKKSLIVVIAFIVCWTPFVSVILMKEITPRTLSNMNRYVSDSLLMFALTNCCINPIVYGTHTSIFSKCFKKITGFEPETTTTANHG